MVATQGGPSGRHPSAETGQMTRLRDNPLVQFSAVSVVVTALVASVVSFVLVTRLDRDVEILERYEAATEMGVAVMPAACRRPANMSGL